jgi:hypothetical protein
VEKTQTWRQTSNNLQWLNANCYWLKNQLLY